MQAESDERSNRILSRGPRHCEYPFREGRIPPAPRCRNLGATQKQAVDALADIAEVGFIPGLKFGDGAAVVADVNECLAHRGPVNIAFTEIDPGVAIFAALEVFEMDFEDGGAEGVNPVLRIAVENDIADVEPGADERMPEFVNVGAHF